MILPNILRRLVFHGHRAFFCGLPLSSVASILFTVSLIVPKDPIITVILVALYSKQLLQMKIFPWQFFYKFLYSAYLVFTLSDFVLSYEGRSQIQESVR